jgi:hypothetical protein
MERKLPLLVHPASCSGQRTQAIRGSIASNTSKSARLTALRCTTQAQLKSDGTIMVIFSESRIEEDLAAYLHIQGTQFCINGDSAYVIREYLIVRFEGTGITIEQAAFNETMSKSRVTAEWILKDIKKYWNHSAYPRKLALCRTPVRVLLEPALFCGTSAPVCTDRRPRAFYGAHHQL